MWFISLTECLVYWLMENHLFSCQAVIDFPTQLLQLCYRCYFFSEIIDGVVSCWIWSLIVKIPEIPVISAIDDCLVFIFSYLLCFLPSKLAISSVTWRLLWCVLQEASLKCDISKCLSQKITGHYKMLYPIMCWWQQAFFLECVSDSSILFQTLLSCVWLINNRGKRTQQKICRPSFDLGKQTLVAWCSFRWPS